MVVYDRKSELVHEEKENVLVEVCSDSDASFTEEDAKQIDDGEDLG